MVLDAQPDDRTPLRGEGFGYDDRIAPPAGDEADRCVARRCFNHRGHGGVAQRARSRLMAKVSIRSSSTTIGCHPTTSHEAHDGHHRLRNVTVMKPVLSVPIRAIRGPSLIHGLHGWARILCANSSGPQIVRRRGFSFNCKTRRLTFIYVSLCRR